MTGPVVFFCMPQLGHLKRLLPLVRDIARRDVPAIVMSHRDFAPAIERIGGRFVDLFSKYPLDAADAESEPPPIRYVAFAAAYADAILRDVRAAGASLIVGDTFAVLAPLIARRLGIPHVNVCAGHDSPPAKLLAGLVVDPRVRISDRCRRAVEALREEHGMADASPFSYVTGLSRELNLYAEPPEFLPPASRPPFEPLAFYGSLPNPEDEPTIAGADPFGDVPPGGLRIYVSFGTVIWRYWTAEALRVMRTISDALADRPEVRVIASLGGTEPPESAVAPIRRPGFRVERYVDQWRVLAAADVTVTHHGLNSTHEAIRHRVPMLSCPFFWDQPGLAARCREFGLAVPLTEEPRGEVGADAVAAALAEVAARREEMAHALETAAGFERAVIGGRDAVVSRMLAMRA